MVEFMCGAARRCITPADYLIEKLPGLMNSYFGGVEDDIFARAISLQDISDEKKEIILLSFDLDKAPCPIENLHRLSKETGLPKDAFLYAGIHTHSAPIFGDRKGEGPNEIEKKPPEVQEATREYEAFLSDTISDLVKEARANRRKARMEYGFGRSHVNVNRLAFYGIRENGSNSSYVGTGTNYERPADPSLFTMVFRDEKNDPIAVFSNYACHNTVMILNKCGHDGKVGISADLGGNVCKKLEEYYPGAVAMWTSGAAGDINPVMSNQQYFEDYRTGRPVERYAAAEIARNMLSLLVAHHYSDIQNTIAAAKSAEGKACLSFSANIAKTRSDYRVRVHKLSIGEITILGFSGELYSGLGRQIRDFYTGIQKPEEKLILINHDGTKLCEAGYIFDDETFEIADRYESDIVGMGHTRQEPGDIFPVLKSVIEAL